jgi:hypothetical protein
MLVYITICRIKHSSGLSIIELSTPELSIVELSTRFPPRLYECSLGQYSSLVVIMRRWQRRGLNADASFVSNPFHIPVAAVLYESRRWQSSLPAANIQ